MIDVSQATTPSRVLSIDELFAGACLSLHGVSCLHGIMCVMADRMPASQTINSKLTKIPSTKTNVTTDNCESC